MSQTTIALLFLAFAIVSFILEKIPLGLTATNLCAWSDADRCVRCINHICTVCQQQCNPLCRYVRSGAGIIRNRHGKAKSEVSLPNFAKTEKTLVHRDNGDRRCDVRFLIQHRNSCRADSCRMRNRR